MENEVYNEIKSLLESNEINEAKPMKKRLYKEYKELILLYREKCKELNQIVNLKKNYREMLKKLKQ